MKTTRIIYQSLIVGIIAVFVALPLIQVPISVSARGTIRPSQEDTKVISMVSGRIVQSNLHQNNQLVQQGDTLLVVTSEALSNKKAYQENLRNDYLVQMADLESLIARKGRATLRTGLYQLEWSSLQKRVAELNAQITLANRELERNTKLYREGVVSLAEYEKSLYHHAQLTEQKNSIQEQQQATWQSKKRELEQQLINLSSDLASLDIETENYVIRASQDGRITNLQGFQAGNHLVQGQHLADISAEESLVAECFVPTSSIGFIEVGQSAKFQIDTYNYNQWGMLEGTVMDINNNVMVNEQTGESYFFVRCQLEQDYLSLKNGYRAQVGKGNTYTACFYLLDRTLWQLLFDRVDDWFNPNLKDQQG